MYGSKKKVNMCILNILREYTDKDHALTQKGIIEKLERDYSITCDRRTVKSYIDDLIDMGWEIDYKKGYKLVKREFDDAELRILIDSILFSKIIPTKRAKRLINKFKDFGSNYFKKKIKHICNLPKLNHTINEQVMESLDVILDAIATEKKIQCVYNEVGTDFKLHPKNDGNPYTINPYQMVENNGKFYLVGNMDQFNYVIHLRIDKMTDVKLLDERRKDSKELEEFDANGFYLPQYMAEHISMFSGKSDWVEIKTSTKMMTTLVDWFGKEFTIEQKDKDYVVIRVKCNLKAVKYWAIQYGPKVELLKPEKLRKEIKIEIDRMWRKYKD
ncbi:Predicted DNA-binding transcriptional regulator YafY, contains an HTH and WYL domains [Anaerovibrio lipolyticus DSM 3074]|uniref:Predicted DNA-binding transcriptional regulator YafY, contains an HTH and WYL domains n=2 Tax=Anaerovibrio lipolyticus TaxID=82374 RepID=A0A1M6FI72_9FIRM|nr:Predicted DNA-binding transcriptional regulator YafY, contains an HTH and WYL domains [Anaerovibrio lipolyticus DSM 3074]